MVLLLLASIDQLDRTEIVLGALNPGSGDGDPQADHNKVSPTGSDRQLTGKHAVILAYLRTITPWVLAAAPIVVTWIQLH
jgi:hypothetical protein